MSVNVGLIPEAVEDLERYAASGNIRRFLAKLVRLEDVGEDAGVPLGRSLVGFRKIVVGDRDWRIIFRMNEAKTAATVWVIGDRADEACYAEAVARLQKRGEDPAAQTLAAVMLELMESKRKRKKKGGVGA